MKETLKSLEPPDSLHLKAAEGWLELGNQLEANEELEKISPQLRVHPAVLVLRWQIYAKEQKWEACGDIARAMIQLAPSQPVGWVHLANSLRRIEGRGIHSAWEALLPIAGKFPKSWNIPYNLACYAAQMQQFNTAEDWLKKAFGIAKTTGSYDKVRLLALNDPDLDHFWKANRNSI